MFLGKSLMIVKGISDLPFVRLIITNTTINTCIFRIHQIRSRIMVSKWIRFRTRPCITSSCTPSEIFKKVKFYPSINRIHTWTFFRGRSLILHQRVSRIIITIQRRIVRISLSVQQFILCKHCTSVNRLKQNVLHTRISTATQRFLIRKHSIYIQANTLIEFGIDLCTEWASIRAMISQQAILSTIIVSQHHLCLIGTCSNIDIMILRQSGTSKYFILPIKRGSTGITIVNTIVSTCIEIGNIRS